MSPDTKITIMSMHKKTKSPRTVIPNGPLIEAYRKAQGWTREEFEWQSHLAVERAALEGSKDGRFLRRYKTKKARGRLAGIGRTTLTNVESSKPVYVFTLKIVAETLGVPVQSLIADEGWSATAAVPADKTESTDTSIAELVNRLRSDGPPITAKELAKILRALLDRIVRP